MSEPLPHRFPRGFPRLYAIVDASCFGSSTALFDYVRCLLDSGVKLIQYRNKMGSGREMLSQAREIRRIAACYELQARSGVFPSGAKAPTPITPIGTAEAVPLPFSNHKESLSTAKIVPLPEEVSAEVSSTAEAFDPILIMNDRSDLALAAGFDGVHVGQDDLSVEAVRAVVGPKMMVGVSTHNPEQVAEADTLDVSYIAVGPVFATASKAKPDPVIGLEGVRRARELTSKPLVAIGGITRGNAAGVIEAGADSVSVIGDLLLSPAKACEEFLKVLG